MYKRILLTFVMMLVLLAGPTVARADELDAGFAWNNHGGKYDFPFGNLIDTHQQTRLLPNGQLQGYIYIQFTGVEINGIPEARRADCTNPALDCRVGWEVMGVPLSGAMLVQKGPRLWDIPAENLPPDPEYVHFHWTNDNLGRNPKKPCGLVVYSEATKVTYSGYLFKRTAVTTFYWLGGNDDRDTGRLVTPGLDMHSNVFGWWTGGGGHGGEEPGGEPGGCGGHDTGGETGDTGCGGHDTGGETGDTGCGGHDTGGETGGETGGCGGETGETGCDGHDSGGDMGGPGGETGGETGGCGETGDTGCEGH